MDYNTARIITLCIGIHMIGIACGRNCYICSTVDGSDENCEDEFQYIENSTVKIDQTCDRYCIKHEVRSSTVIPNHYRPHSITRTCGPQCLDICTEVKGMETCIYCCFEDFCNGAYKLPLQKTNFAVLVLGMLLKIGFT